MKLIKLGVALHDCEKLAWGWRWDMENDARKAQIIHPGTVVECDCGNQLTLVDDQTWKVTKP